MQTGSLDGTGGDLPDAHMGSGSGNPDAGMSAGACVGAATDVGAPSSFLLNKAVQPSGQKFFVVRDSGGLYALSSLCTHEGAALDPPNSAQQFFCPRHGALFTINGAIVSGPVNRVLVHYSMCTLSNGHVGVQTNMQVAAGARLVA